MKVEKIENVIALGDIESDRSSGDPNRETEARAFENLRSNLRGVASILYYKPTVVGKRGQSKEPDILWIHPHLGILVIEVKAWDLEFLKECEIGDDDRIYYRGQGEGHKDPNKEAKEFVDFILDVVERKVPVRYIVYFPNLTPGDYEKVPYPLRSRLPREKCLFKHEKNVLEKLISAFEGFQRGMLKKPVTEEDFEFIRRKLFPHKAVSKSDFSFTEKDIPVLDLYQESLLYNLKEGKYRILRGTAGSGKTVVLIAKGVHEKLSNRSKRIIFVTFANSLANEIGSSIGNLIRSRNLPLSTEDFEITTIHTLMGKLYRKYIGTSDGLPPQELEKRIIEYVESNPLGDEDKYDVILCDETQDFKKDYFKLIKAMEKDRTIIVFGVDETQRIYEYEKDGVAPWVWEHVGYPARGKTDILKRSYRNPSGIFAVAVEFLKKDKVLADRLKEIELEDSYSIRTDEGHVEMFIGNEFELTEQIIKHLIGKGYNPGNIFILCATSQLAQRFKEVAGRVVGPDNVHFFSYESDKGDKFIPSNKLVVMPYKSSKGLERPVVVVTGTHILPYTHRERVEEKRLDRRTLYVALTRAQKELYITAQKRKGFAEELEEIIKNHPLGVVRS